MSELNQPSAIQQRDQRDSRDQGPYQELNLDLPFAQQAPQHQLHQPRGQRDATWSNRLHDTAAGVAGAAGGIVGGAVNLTGQAFGNAGRGVGKILNDAGDGLESTAQGVKESVDEMTGRRYDGNNKQHHQAKQ